jgi:hypothetical protein
MTNYIKRNTRITLCRENDRLFSPGITHIEITDEAAGEFIIVRQQLETDQNTIAIDPEEWPHLRDAIETMIEKLKNNDEINK